MSIVRSITVNENQIEIMDAKKLLKKHLALIPKDVYLSDKQLDMYRNDAIKAAIEEAYELGKNDDVKE